MATPIIMPRQGQSVESCIISKWYKKKGDQVQEGEVLFSYETDKAAFDEEAQVSGTLLDIFFEEGDDVPVLTTVCVVGNEGESTAELSPKTSKAAEEKPADAVPTADTAVESKNEIKPQAIPVNNIEGIKISPRAKNLAEKNGVDYRQASPSGPYGRIIERDIAALRESGHVITSSAKGEYSAMVTVNTIRGTGIGGRITTADLKNAPAPVKAEIVSSAHAEYEEVKLPNIRKVIAKAMYHSIASTAQLTLNSSFDATGILALRKKFKESGNKLGLENITLNDIILYAVSRTLPYHRDLNAHFLEDKMLHFNNVHLGVAVDTERGLMVPNILNANLKSLNEISAEVKKLVQDCQKGTINPDLLKGGSFTITNLGTLGIESFTPVLNAPQTGILGVCNIVQRAREAKEGIEYYPAMGLSLTFDHRALDGAPAAKFLQDLKNNLENFSVLLAR